MRENNVILIFVMVSTFNSLVAIKGIKASKRPEPVAV